MTPLVEVVPTRHTPLTLGRLVAKEPGAVVLLAALPDAWGRSLSVVAARPLVTFTSRGAESEVREAGGRVERQFGNPWRILSPLLGQFELPGHSGTRLPLGGAIGHFGYELNQFVEPRLSRRAINDLELPDCHLGFHGSLVVFDGGLANVVATGLEPDGSRNPARAAIDMSWWKERLAEPLPPTCGPVTDGRATSVRASLEGPFYTAAVRRAQGYIHTGDIYQVNLARRLAAFLSAEPWQLFENLVAQSPAPYAAFIRSPGFDLVSASPELFLSMDDRRVVTRPIKGTRPRGKDAASDQRMAAELLASEKERAELTMITDLLRNDLGRVAEFGSVRVPELLRLESYAHVHHLVSTVEASLREGVTHLDALEACFPGGSITGAPKLRAMEIIDEIEPVARGPYCGCHGFLGFNSRSRLAITIRTALVRDGWAWFHAGPASFRTRSRRRSWPRRKPRPRGFLQRWASTSPHVRPWHEPVAEDCLAEWTPSALCGGAVAFVRPGAASGGFVV